ncbi:MAG: hypothetical protein HY645_05910 [Acidobacteria bacterium]|nr:hypothetical protein [Acidobacteriota bacterium]
MDWLTVAALTSGPVPPRQNFWLCRDSDCDVVYFGEEGYLLRIADLRMVPGFKHGGGERLICYCFNYRRRDIEAEIRTKGHASNIVRRITGEVQAGNCACQVRNPSGRCCLGEFKKAEAEIRREVQL